MPTSAVFLDTTATDADDEAEGKFINEFYTRADAEACIQALIIGPTQLTATFPSGRAEISPATSCQPPPARRCAGEIHNM